MCPPPLLGEEAEPNKKKKKAAAQPHSPGVEVPGFKFTSASLQGPCSFHLITLTLRRLMLQK